MTKRTTRSRHPFTVPFVGAVCLASTIGFTAIAQDAESDASETTPPRRSYQLDDGLAPPPPPIVARPESSVPRTDTDGLDAADLRLSPSEATYWNSPQFRRRFLESYMSETEVEPRLGEREFERLEEVLRLIGDDDAARAARRLEGWRGPNANAIYDMQVANIYYEAKDYERAEAAYREAVRKHPKFRRAWKNLGVMLTDTNDHENAVKALARAIELGGGDSVTYGVLGFSYSALGKHIAAESAFRMAMILDPETVEWQVGLAQSLGSQQRWADVVAIASQLIRDRPEVVDFWRMQSNAYLGLEQPLRAAEALEMAHQISGGSFDSLALLGDIFVKEGLYDLGVDNYLLAIDAEEESVDYVRFVNSAQIMTRQRALQPAERLLDEIELHHRQKMDDAEFRELMKVRAQIALAAGHPDAEADVLEEMVRLDPLDGDALILLGQFYSRNGDVPRAILTFRRAAGIEAFEAEAKVQHARVLVQERKFREAVPLLKRAQEIRPLETVARYLDQVSDLANTR